MNDAPAAEDRSSDDGASARLGLDDRVLASAAAALERLGPSLETGGADEVARRAGGDLEQRIIARAQALPSAVPLRHALLNVRHTIGLLVLAGLVLAFIAGVGAARAALDAQRDAPVNFYWALGATLGVQSFFLLLWFVIMIATRQQDRRGGANVGMSLATVGGWIWRLAQFLAGRIHKGNEQTAAVSAMGQVHLHGLLGRWTLSSISHAVWLGFNIACLASLIVMLSARQYTFAWETTVLSERQYVPLTRALAALPEVAGFITPTSEQIAASQWPFAQQPGHEVSQAWSGLLIGAIVIYGFAPRLLLLGLALGRRRQLAKAYRLDVNQPEFVRLQARVMPAEVRIGVVDAEDSPNGVIQPLHQRASTTRPLGSPAILGFELPRAAGDRYWPPALHDVRWIDLGMVDGRDDQHRVLQSLVNWPEEPRTVVMICSLTAAPDRGVAAFIAALRQVASQPITLVLSGGDALRQRLNSEQFAQRIDDWRNLALRSGLDESRIVEVDLDHFTQNSAAKLSAAIATGAALALTHRHIEEAVELIAEASAKWFKAATSPSVAEQAELHRALARLYQGKSAQWSDWLGTPADLGANLVPRLRNSAEQLTNLLPARLRQSGPWIVAGATAGALGCLAIATFVTPVAISALPVWSALGGLGGALSGIMSHYRQTPSNAAPPTPSEAVIADRSNAVRSAALFALVLELQGRDEQLITRILDRVISDEIEAAQFADEAQVSRWLKELRHRLDMAIAQETAR